jgi:hypothetical protein
MATELSIQQIIDEDFFDQAECGMHLGKTPRTLDRWEKLGIGPPVTLIRKRRFYEKRAVFEWERQQERDRKKKNHDSGFGVQRAAASRGGSR